MLGGRLHAERADDAHLLAERDRECGIGRAASDQQCRRVVQRIGPGKHGTGFAVHSTQHRRMQCPHPECRVGAPRQPREGRIGAIEGQGVARR